MAISSNPNSRPNSRNSESNSPMRRSFTGNPFQRHSMQPNPRSFVAATPANSPTEFVRTNPFGKEEKENEKDPEALKPAKARSPAVSKGLNRFMAPTISAASKINPSPRKKVLADRNETFRTSLSFSEGNGRSDSANISDFTEDFDQKPDKGFDSKASEIVKDVLETPPNTNRILKFPSQNSKILPPSHSSDFSESSEIKPIIRSGSKLFASSISPSIAPQDADPSLPPYDPKMNYLSPRPQFLHYRPNPRLKFYYQKEQSSRTKNLEDSFLSESSVDTEASEESDSENSQKESENDSSVEGRNEISEKESENDSSVEAINEKTEKESENDSLVEAICEKSEKDSEDASSAKDVDKVVEPEVFKPETNTSPVSTLVSMETREEKRVVKSRFFDRAKVIPLLLVLLIGFLSLSYTCYPIFGSAVYENLSRSKFYEESFIDFARNLRQLSVYSKSYVNELISSFRRGDKFGSMQFINLTSMLEDPFINTKRFEEIYEQDEVEPMLEHEDEFKSQLDGNQENGIDLESEMIQPIASNLQHGISFEKKSCPEAPEFNPEEAVSEAIKEDDHSDFKFDYSTALSSFENTFVMVSLSDVPSLEQGDLIVSDSEIESSTAVPSSGNTFEIGNFQVNPEYNSEKDGEIKGDDPIISDFKIEPETIKPDSGNTFEMDLTPKYESSKQYETVSLAISLLAIALIAAPVFIYLKNYKSNAGISSDLVDPILTNETKQSNLSQQNYSPEVDLVGESYPSEMSSFDKSHSYSKWRMWGTTNEAQSPERKERRAFKRESLASSSEFSMNDSPSYGSFTTYEKLPSKHGYGDDEVITPVRRSSRIKKIQVTSS